MTLAKGSVTRYMLSTEKAKELYSRYHELRAREWHAFMEQREAEHHTALQTYRADITNLEIRLALVEGSQNNLRWTMVGMTTSVMCAGIYFLFLTLQKTAHP